MELQLACRAPSERPLKSVKLYKPVPGQAKAASGHVMTQVEGIDM